MPIKLEVMPYLDELTEEARATGSVNTTFFRQQDDQVRHIGHNTDVLGLRNVILQNLKPDLPFEALSPAIRFGEGRISGFVIGAGGAARAAIYALHKLEVSPILLVNRDAQETLSARKQFPQLDIRIPESLKQLEDHLTILADAGTPCLIGVGCVPSEEPKTDAERLIYTFIELILGRGTQPHLSQLSEHGLAITPLFLDMAYKPIMTRFRKLAERYAWLSVSGADIVEQICYEQSRLWTGLTVSSEGRRKVRQALREDADVAQAMA